MTTDDLYRLLRTGHAQAQGIVDTISDPLLVLDSSLCVQAVSLAFLEIFGVDRYETIGQPLCELGNGQWDIPELRHLLADVIPKVSAVIDYQVEHDFPGLGHRVMLVTARTLRTPDGASHTMLLTIVDVTERQRRDAAQTLVVSELRHRLKNLLAVTQSLAHLTKTEGRSAEEYRDDFMGRFTALIEAQDIAFSEQRETDLKELIARIVAPYGADCAAVAIEQGPAVKLPPRVITGLCLVLHEMATNAAKYGALSVAKGHVRVTWMVEDDGSLRLKWTEAGGPPVVEAAKEGFGATLIQSTITYTLSGHAELDYAADGFRAEIVIPLGGQAPQG